MNPPRADLQPYFDRFLERLQLDPSRVQRIEQSLRHLEQIVVDDRFLRRRRPRIFLQGSYAQGLAVRPLDPQADYDVDVVIEMDFGLTVSSTATLDWFAARLGNDSVFGERLVRHDRCVRVEYAGAFHLDVVPARRIRTPGGTFQGRIKVPDRQSGWRSSYPRGFARWCEFQQRRTGGDFSRVVQMLKRWRDLKQPESRQIRSIVFTTLIGRHVPNWRVAGNPSTRPDGDVLTQTLVRLDRYLQSRTSAPRVSNPSLLGENLARSWTTRDFALFRRAVHEAMGMALGAQIVGRPTAWQSLFGRSFPSS